MTGSQGGIKGTSDNLEPQEEAEWADYIGVNLKEHTFKFLNSNSCDRLRKLRVGLSSLTNYLPFAIWTEISHISKASADLTPRMNSNIRYTIYKVFIPPTRQVSRASSPAEPTQGHSLH